MNQEHMIMVMKTKIQKYKMVLHSQTKGVDDQRKIEDSKSIEIVVSLKGWIVKSGGESAPE